MIEHISRIMKRKDLLLNHLLFLSPSFMDNVGQECHESDDAQDAGGKEISHMRHRPSGIIKAESQGNETTPSMPSAQGPNPRLLPLVTQNAG